MADSVYKTDLSFVPNASGDIDRISGLDNVKKAIFRRITTNPGAFAWRPDYGVGIGQFQNGKLTLGVQREIASRITEQLLLDPRITGVVGIAISRDQSKTDQINIVVRVNVVGFGEQTFSYVVGDIQGWP